MGVAVFALYTALIIIASLNRETGIVLVLCYTAFFPAEWRKTGLLGALWLIVQIGLHVWLGAAPIQYSLEATLATNIKTLPNVLLSNALLAPLWILVIRGYRHANGLFRRFYAIALVYLVLVLFGGLWQEVRLLLILFPLMLPTIRICDEAPAR